MTKGPGDHDRGHYLPLSIDEFRWQKANHGNKVHHPPHKNHHYIPIAQILPGRLLLIQRSGKLWGSWVQLVAGKKVGVSASSGGISSGDHRDVPTSGACNTRGDEQGMEQMLFSERETTVVGNSSCKESGEVLAVVNEYTVREHRVTCDPGAVVYLTH